MKKIIPFLILLFLFSICLFSQERGFKVVAATSEGEIVNLYKECYALVIGVSDYESSWPNLPNTTRDADEIGDLLEDLGFKVSRVKNPTKDQLIRSLEDLVYGPGQETDNCLVIFYAGHGHTEKLAYGDDMGYIVPKDAPSPNIDNPGFMKKAINMRIIDSYARSIQAKHVLFLFDSCFSGAIFNITRALPPKYISYKTERSVRQFITAGGADETVPDKSDFKDLLIDGLKGEADRNEDGYVTGSELGEYLQEKVVIYSYGNQHPQYGKIRDRNLDKGDFVFELKSKSEETETPINPDLGYGYLLISSYPLTTVKVDGKPYGMVPPVLEVKLPEGKHTLSFFRKDLNIEKTIVVGLLKGERKRIHERFDQ